MQSSEKEVLKVTGDYAYGELGFPALGITTNATMNIPFEKQAIGFDLNQSSSTQHCFLLDIRKKWVRSSKNKLARVKYNLIAGEQPRAHSDLFRKSLVLGPNDQWLKRYIVLSIDPVEKKFREQCTERQKTVFANYYKTPMESLNPTGERASEEVRQYDSCEGNAHGAYDWEYEGFDWDYMEKVLTG
ncbi:MAG: hypothetical protein EZS28_026272 [Streblomastix strix]|uniref:Uncharacterized protein n=1 Tax=Streblomastix strix TaxID=222440 RepID=A0A5J4V7J3_9EUKA|nr:MAG: hypothetical protein EZS28_026272 [Streblomastix strix]